MMVDTGDLSSVHLNVYSVDTGEQLSDTPFHGFDTGGIIGISRDGSRLMVETANVYSQCGGYIHRLYLVEIPSMETILDRGLQILAYDASLNNLESQSFSHNSRLLAVSDGYSITIYDAQDGTEIVELDETVSRLAYFNPDDTLIVTTGEDGTIRLYGVLGDDE